jgi:catechol 2,3-dioxygenase-like lactoylglutathione lyase family enzyme
VVLGLSHITLVVRNLDRMEEILSKLFGARKIYDSGDEIFSLSAERFFLVGAGAESIWIATMEGGPLPTQTYNHIAFRIADADYDDYVSRLGDLGLTCREGRSRVEGEGRSIYFYDDDNHLFELHTGALNDRLTRYAQAPAAV